MTREECESQIIAKLAEIREIAAEYMEREPTYLAMFVTHEEGKRGAIPATTVTGQKTGTTTISPLADGSITHDWP